MEKILITGVAGFIGSRVASRFIREGYTVIGVDDFSTGRIENVPPETIFIEADLSQASTIKEIPPDCRKVLHLAGQSSGEISFDDPVADLNKNTSSSLNLIRYGIENNIERFVYASSMSVYGAVEDKPISEDHHVAPLSCYGVSKLASERYLRVFSNKIPYVALRMFNVYGPGQDMSNLRQGMVSIYLAQALRNSRIEVKGGIHRFRDFIYIDDVVEIWYRAANYTSAIGETLNVGTGIKTSVDALLKYVLKILPESDYFVSDVTPGDQEGIYADTKKLCEILEMNSFISLDVGIKRFVEWALDSQL